MTLFGCFFIGLFFSFIGSIPPGTINITTMQYAISDRKNAAISFAAACAITEYLYAGIAVKFQMFLTENTAFSENFQLISGLVLLLLGIINLTKGLGKKSEKDVSGSNLKLLEKRNAFKKGVLISLANPLAIPFWLAVTAYLQSMGWIVLTGINMYIYVAGISMGTFLLLLLVAQLGRQFTHIKDNKFIVYRMPGIIFLCMGIYTFYQ